MKTFTNSEEATKNITIQAKITSISFALLVIKFIAYFITGSVAIFTDALESIVNVVAGLLGLYSLYISAKPKDKNHPYGHGRIEYISASIEGTMILIAGLLIIYEAVYYAIYPKELEQLDYGILLITFSGIVNFAVGYYSANRGKATNSPALTASGKHLLSDSYSTAGILIGLLLIYITNLTIIDSIAAALFGILIVVEGAKIIKSSIADIMDETDLSLIEEIGNELQENRVDKWIDIHNFRIVKAGHIFHIDCHVTFPWYLSTKEAHDELDAIDELIHNKFGKNVEVFAHIDPCKVHSCKVCMIKDCKVRQAEFEKQVIWNTENLQKDQSHRI